MTFVLDTISHCGEYEFKDFHPRRSYYNSRQWVVFGVNHEKYGPSGYVKLCAYPDRPKARGRLYFYRRGWATKREAQEVADWLNRAAS